MNKIDKIQILLGERDGAIFARFLGEKLDASAAPAGVKVSFVVGQPPLTGAGFPVPPEVVLVVSSAAGMVAGAALTEFGKQMGKWLWDELDQFFSEHAQGDRPRQLRLRINGAEVAVPLITSAENPLVDIHITLPESAAGDREEPLNRENG